MAAKAKLTLSQLLFRRTSNSSASNSNNTSNNCSYINCSDTNSNSANNNVNINNNTSKSKNCIINRESNTETLNYDQFANFHEQLQIVNRVFPPKRVQANFATVSAASGRQGYYEIQNRQETRRKKTNESQHQLHGILKNSAKNNGNHDTFARPVPTGGKTTRSSLHRSKSNPNPSNSNPLKEVSWNCPTLEKRREVILNYFEKVILENKQEQSVQISQPNISCDDNNDGEPIYEEISERPYQPSSSSSVYYPCNTNPEIEKTGSLKPKISPKKVRMNIPQDQQKYNYSKSSPIYDKVLCRSHSMIEPSTSSSFASSYYSNGSSGYYELAPSTISSSDAHSSYYENFSPYSSSALSTSSSSGSDYAVLDNIQGTKNIFLTRIAGRSHSFHEEHPIPSSHFATGGYNIQCFPTTATNSPIDMDQMYAKVCKRKKRKEPGNNENQFPFMNVERDDNNTTTNISVQVSCENGVTMIPVVMPCSSTFSTSSLSLSSSSDNNDPMNSPVPSALTTTTIRRNSDCNNEAETNGLIHYYNSEKILPNKDIGYMNSSVHVSGKNLKQNRNHNNLSVVHLLASYDSTKDIEEFIPTTPTPSFTAIINSSDSPSKSIFVPVQGAGFNNSNLNKTVAVEKSEDHRARSKTTALVKNPQHPPFVQNCSYSFGVADYKEVRDKDHEKLSSSTSCSSASSNTDTDREMDDDYEEDHDGGGETKYSFPDAVRGITLLKKTTFQDDPKELLQFTSDSEEEEEFYEHKSLLEMTSTRDILNESTLQTGDDKYGGMMDDEDRGFDSFLDENDGGSSSPEGKGEQPFRAENLRDQRTFAQSQQDVPQETLKKKAASVLDLINSEISDLHMRELELKKLHSPSPPATENSGEIIDNTREEFSGEEGSSGEDDFSDSAIEYDGFTTNGSHSSGQVSPSDNLNEMTSPHHDQEEAEEPSEQQEIAVTGSENENANEEISHSSPVTVTASAAVEDEVDSKEAEEVKKPQRYKVRPLTEEEDKSIKFSALSETPIEREIRLTREREEEFRKLNSLKRANSTDNSQQTTASLPTLKPKPVLSRPVRQERPESASFHQSTGDKDAQYELATARFKREIEESMQREKELMIETRLSRTVSECSSTDDVVKPNADLAIPPKDLGDDEQKESEDGSVTTEQPVQHGPENVLRKPTLAKLPINKLPAARFFSPPAYNVNKPNRIAPVVSPIRGGNSPGVNKQGFMSLEKYILQTSYNYRSNKATTAPVITDEVPKIVAETPAAAPTSVAVSKEQPITQTPITDDPLRIILQKKNSTEEEEGEEKEAEEKPKRRYVPAQDKIHQEIKELVLREKELTKSRGKWKSTLDLPEMMNNDESNGNDDISKSTLSLHSSVKVSATALAVANDPDAVVLRQNHNDLDFKKVVEDVKQVTRVKAPARRRHSLLITQWEERIRQQQEMNNKK